MKDEQFIRGKVPMTKEEVRLLTIEKLQLAHAQCWLDVGAGTGSVCIEASLRYPQLHTIAIEKNEEARQLIQQNCAKFQVNNLQIIAGTAPFPLPVEQVDAIFIGGSGGHLPHLLPWAIKYLKPHGRLVLNFILLNNLLETLDLLDHSPIRDLDVSQVSIATLNRLGTGIYFKPNNPTYIISCSKAGQDE